MKVKVKKEFELHSNNKVYENDVLDLITINYDIDGLLVILEKYRHIFKVYFEDEFDANEHLEFNYQDNEVCSAEIWITENESDKRLSELAKKKDKKIEYWKAKCMKLLDKM